MPSLVSARLWNVFRGGVRWIRIHLTAKEPEFTVADRSVYLVVSW
jgi:hypothetical protein